MLESLDFYPGGFPGRFGRHHGGVVALESRSPAEDGFHGSAKVDFIDSGGYMRTPITKDIDVAFAGRRSYIDAFLGFVVPQPSAGGQRIVTPVYYDYQGRIDWNLHQDGKLSLFVIGSSDALHVLNQDNSTTVSTDLNSAVDFFRVIATYVRPLGGDLKLTISPAWGRDTISFTGAQAMASGPFTSLDVVNSTLSYRMRVNGRLSDHLVLDTGLDVLSRVTSYTALVPIDDNIRNSSGIDIPPSSVFRGSQSVGVGEYIDLGIDVTNNLRLIPTLRVDEYLLDAESRASIDPRLVARLKLSPEWTLKAYLGQFSEPPQPEALDKRFGNPNVGLEHGYHSGIGYEWRPDHLWSIDSEIYYEYRNHLVVFSDQVMMSDGNIVYTNFNNDGIEYSEGFELLVKREISAHAYGYLSYTYSKSKQQNHPDSVLAAGTFDQPHVLNAVVSWKPGGGWELGARLQFASGRPTTPVIGATYDADAGEYVPINGATRSVREPDFEQLDARVEHDWLYDTWSLGLYIDVINVTNTKNEEAIQWDYRYRHSAPVTSFPILPTLGVRGTW
jgi:hypothetical protein